MKKKMRISELYFDLHSPVVNVDRLCVCHLPLMQGLSAVAPSGTPEWSFQIRNPFGLLDFFEEESKKEKKKKEKRIKENKKTRRKKRENCEKMDLAKEGFWCWQELNDRDGFCPFISPSRLFCNNIWCWLRILDWKGKNVYIEGCTKRQSRFLFGIFTWRGMKWFSYYFSI